MSIQAQTHIYVNPWINLGYAFGESGGFVFGYELSIVGYRQNYEDNIYGLVFDYDWVGDTKKMHIGFEYIQRMVGLDIGPSFALKENKSFTGFSIIPFGGLLLYPHYNFTYFNSELNFHEFGTYLKIPIGDTRFGLQ